MKHIINFTNLSKMKKIIIYVVSALVLVNISSCNRDEDYLFGESIDARLQAKLQEYADALCNAPNGWLVAVGTQNTGANGGAYRMYMKFTPDNRVIMYSDQNATTAVTPKTSSWRLKALQYPTLMFDTYNYIHAMADPSVAIPGGSAGQGLSSDFDFNFETENSMDGNEMYAIGRFNRCPIILTKATAEEEQLITGGAVLTNIKTIALANMPPNATINVGGFYVYMSVAGRMATIAYKDRHNDVKFLTIPSYPELNGDIRLMFPFEYGLKFDRIAWDGTKYYVMVNGTRYDVYNHGKPPFAFTSAFGIGKYFSMLTVDKSELNTTGGNSMVAPFLTLYNTAQARMQTTPDYPGAFHLRKFTIDFTRGALGKMMKLTIWTSNPSILGPVVYQASFTYKLNEDPDGTVYFTDFTSMAIPSNSFLGIFAYAHFDNLFSYFLYSGRGEIQITDKAAVLVVNPSGNKFKLDWAPNNTPGLSAMLGGLFLVSNPAEYVPGTLSSSN